MVGFRVVGCVFLTVFVAVGCNGMRSGKHYSIKHSQIVGGVTGPYTPIRVRSPTEIDVLVVEGGVRRKLTLELRGVRKSPDERFNADVVRWLDRSIRDYLGGGVYAVSDTIDRPSEGVIRGVLLSPLQGSVAHNVDTGEDSVSVFRYRILQSYGLTLGKFLLDETESEFGWDREFEHFQEEARQDSIGYWAIRPVGVIH